MKEEVTTISNIVIDLKRKYDTGRCLHCHLLQDYLKSKVDNARVRLKTLEGLSNTNDLTFSLDLAEANSTAGILGLYLTV